MVKIVSWNLLHQTGASLADVVRLVRRERPDLLLLQEATAEMDALATELGGQFFRTPLPGRRHGLAMWSRTGFPSPPVVLPLPAGAMFDRVSQVVTLGNLGIANVHLSHGQLLNRRQLRRIAAVLPPRAAVLGDYNLVGPALLRGFRDVGPREPTHKAGDVVPLRIDRCLVRGLACTEARALLRERSDHRPIVVELAPAAFQRGRGEAWRAGLRRTAIYNRTRAGLLQLGLYRQPAQNPRQHAPGQRGTGLLPQDARAPLDLVGPGKPPGA